MLMALAVLTQHAAAQDLSALARFDPAASAMRDTGQGIELRLSISQPVPWRVRLMDNPPRMVLDMREVDWRGLQGMPRQGARVREVRAACFVRAGRGWWRNCQGRSR